MNVTLFDSNTYLKFDMDKKILFKVIGNNFCVKCPSSAPLVSRCILVQVAQKQQQLRVASSCINRKMYLLILN